MGKLTAWIEKLLSSSSKPTEPASSTFGAENRARADAEKAKDYDMKMAIERERSRRSSF